jgi:UDP-N-acetyl-D-galactosamine dehydrogenase
MQSPIPTIDNIRIAIIGLGYVGLPLAVEFGRRYPTVGFDIDAHRIEELHAGVDVTRETEPDELQASTHLSLSSDMASLESANVFIVTVPTPVDRYKRPDLSPLEGASRTVGRVLQPGSIVIYESTVFPGATEDICAPILEAGSGLKSDRDFYLGYSPERINPGDKKHVLKTITKITAGSTPEVAEFVDRLYASIVTAGTHKAASIKVAEAAKVIENTQRDLNIALVNELAVIFHRIGIDTVSVLEAAGTKWNFLPFRPGLVGGHCIGVDPYYLTHKAQELGYHPAVILAGRRINDDMGEFIAERVIKLMARRRMHVVESKILVMGLTFKENCPDIRNTKVIDVIKELQGYHADVEVYDPWVVPEEAEHEFGMELIRAPDPGRYDAIVIAVPHNEFVAMGAEKIRALGKPGAVVFDIKCMLPQGEADERL